MHHFQQLLQHASIGRYKPMNVESRTQVYSAHYDIDCPRCLSVIRCSPKGVHEKGQGCADYLQRQQAPTLIGYGKTILEERMRHENTGRGGSFFWSEMLENMPLADLRQLAHEANRILDRRIAVEEQGDALVALTAKSQLFPRSFDTHKDSNMVETMAQLHDYPGSKPNFVPRSSMRQPLGLLSRAAGMDWVKVDNFHNRLLTMAHVFECRENLHCLESQFERDAMKIDLAMQVRLNSRFRAHTPSSKFATGHYRHHFQQRMRAGISREHALQELIVNAALVRTTLSFEVRCALKGLIFPWLHVCNGG